jgi:16S rRNA (cytidine1402-2'-O)-methyltransferase
VLKEVAVIAAEDTRRTQILLRHYDISTRTLSYHDHSPPFRRDALLDTLRAGQSVALVTDAGTPGISDPGYELVTAAIQAGITVTPIPGASAVIPALCVSGLPTQRFVFEGFLPRQRSARHEILERLRMETRTIVLYEAPHHLAATLRILADKLGPRPVAIARELTKLFEEVWRGTLSEAADRWSEGARGEFVIVVGGRATDSPSSAPRDAGPAGCDDDGSNSISRCRERIIELQAGGSGLREASRLAAEECGVPFRQAYRAGLEMKRCQSSEGIASGPGQDEAPDCR